MSWYMLYVYMDLYIHTHIPRYMYIYTYVHIHRYTSIHIYEIYLPINLHMYSHAQIHVYMLMHLYRYTERRSKREQKKGKAIKRPTTNKAKGRKRNAPIKRVSRTQLARRSLWWAAATAATRGQCDRLNEVLTLHNDRRCLTIFSLSLLSLSLSFI